MNSSHLHCYSMHSHFTDPQMYEPYLTALPKDVASLCDIIQGIMIHEVDGELFGVIYPPARFFEMRLRYVAKILERIMQLQTSPLHYKRLPKYKIIGTCRDFALLLVAMCRAVGIPARMRIGFSTYTCPDPDFLGDHSVVEYWNEEQCRWILIDPRVSTEHFTKKKYPCTFNPLHLTDNEFYSAAAVWLASQDGKLNPEQFGFGLQKQFKGLWYIRNRLMHDFAAVYKWEMLPTDTWGYMFYEPPHSPLTHPEMLQTITHLATALACPHVLPITLKPFWENPSLRVPSIVMNYDRYSGPRADDVS